VRVEQIEVRSIIARARDQICTAQIGNVFPVEPFADHVRTVEQVIRPRGEGHLRCPDALRIVGIGCRPLVLRCGDELIQGVVDVGRASRAAASCKYRL